MTRAIPAAASKQFQGRLLPATSYVIVGFAWFAFLMIALKVRMIEPVFLWVMTQGLLVERVVPIEGGWWISRGILLAAYMAAGLIAWWIVERPGRDPRHVWRRAILAWFGIQALYCLVATTLVQAGVLYE